MRAAVIALVLASCSYDWNSVNTYYQRDASSDGPLPGDPHHVILAGFACNPVSGDGCTDPSSCLGRIESNQTIGRLVCRPAPGSTGRGSYCGDESFCVSGHVCWTDPSDPGGTHRTCERPCFIDTDCDTGGHCDTSGAYAVHYDRATLYRCR